MDTLKQAFKNIKEIEPSNSIKMAILSRIKLEKVRQIKRKLILSYIGLVGSIAIGVYTTLFFGSAFLKSEFWSMISLAFSDGGIIAIYWNDFLYSLMETFPALTVAIILVPIFTLLLSISSYIDLSNKNHHKYI
jgi:hypothetical protein